jgi:hypothetical protein
MAEVSKDAMTLISISWQALNRAYNNNEDTLLCDCTVIILFASIFIESNLNYIIDNMKANKKMKDFVGNQNQHPGLQDKLYWFYNEYIAKDKAKKKKTYKVIRKRLGRKFPGFCMLTKFRNEISHGYINPSIANLSRTNELREQAKDIVDNLFSIANKNGYEITRIINYDDISRSQTNQKEASSNIHNILHSKYSASSS